MTQLDGTLALDRVSHAYGNVAALRHVSFEAPPGEILAVTGPSGAGKTTVCRLISGIERASEGDVRLAGRSIATLPPQRRNIAYMFESYALYPQLTVFENIASPLRSPRQDKSLSQGDIAVRVNEVLALTEMAQLAERLPSALSGGQKQRVALCRNLVQEPAVYLLDEPISHLDAKLRHKLRGEIRRRQTAKPLPTLWFTPDAMEALSIGDRVAVLVEGQIQQIDTPDDLYRRPANTMVAKLVGDPAMNLLSGRLTEQEGRLCFLHDSCAIALQAELAGRLGTAGGGKSHVLGVRPTEIAILAPDDGSAALCCEVYAHEPFGKYSIVTVQIGKELVKVKTNDARSYHSGDRVGLSFSAREFVLFNAETGAAI